ncbi:MAG TPA: glycosyltransferase family 4 protein [Caulobacteraceae bacterium]|jgi:glycosyltransferase involved in cell wall biosynthesis|nr:glycosyltransferase family 4 protein [Caulobacteraceae bacterium]
MRDESRPPKVVLFANTDWYLYNFRLSLIRRLRDDGCDVVLISPPGDYGEKLQALGFRWIALPMQRRSLNPFREAGLVNHIARLLRDERADLIHGFTIKPAVYGGLAGRRAGVRARVSAVAGLGWVFINSSVKARALRPVVATLLRLALGGDGARLILQNPDDEALFAQARLIDPKCVRVIKGSGVDCNRFTPPGASNDAPGSDDPPLRVLVAARLLWDKGLQEYVDAARALKALGRNIRFLLAGDPDPGNPAAVPVETIKAWSDEGLIEWLGHVSDMPALFHSVDVVALPSYREGLPKSMIEAGACARALITTDAPGCREVVADGVDGLLVPVKDAAALAGAIARLDDDRALLQRLGEAARKRALSDFDEEIVLAATVAVYRELLGDAAAVGRTAS